MYLERFLKKVSKMPLSDGGCWMWRGSKKDTGYGLFSYKGKVRKAHRVSWMLHRGEIPKGLFVCHKCDVPLCVNPDHLFLGSAADNTADMLRKGRQGCLAKLNESKVYEILRLYQEGGTSFVRLGKQFGVAPTTVASILSGKKWRHVQRPAPIHDWTQW